MHRQLKSRASLSVVIAIPCVRQFVVRPILLGYCNVVWLLAICKALEIVFCWVSAAQHHVCMSTQNNIAKKARQEIPDKDNIKYNYIY